MAPWLGFFSLLFSPPECAAGQGSAGAGGERPQGGRGQPAPSTLPRGSGKRGQLRQTQNQGFWEVWGGNPSLHQWWDFPPLPGDPHRAFPAWSRDGGAETAPMPGALPCPALAKPHQKPHSPGLSQGIFLPLKYGN